MLIMHCMAPAPINTRMSLKVQNQVDAHILAFTDLSLRRKVAMDVGQRLRRRLNPTRPSFRGRPRRTPQSMHALRWPLLEPILDKIALRVG
jgi:hypothetical protein